MLPMTRQPLLPLLLASALLFSCGPQATCKNDGGESSGANATGPSVKPRQATTAKSDGEPAPEDAAGGATSLTLATWNIYWFSGAKDGKAPRSDEDIELLASYRDKLEADVIALQEIDGIESLKLLFPQDAWHAACEKRDHKQQVCLVVKKSSGWEITSAADYTPLNTNGYLRAGLDVTLSRAATTPLRLLAVHMKSGCFDHPPGHDTNACDGFYGQLPHLEAWIDARASEKAPFVVLGDFNRRFSQPKDEAWTELDDAEPEGLTLKRSIEGDAPCWDTKYPDYIDHIVLGGDATGWLQSSKQLVYTHGTHKTHHKRLSDHCPLAATLSVPMAE